MNIIHKNKPRGLALIIGVAIIGLGIFGLVPSAFAQTCGTCPAGSFCNPIQSCTFADLVEKIAKAISAIAIPFVAIMLVWSGFLFVTARGNEEQLKTAKKTLQWALIGGAIVVGAYALATAVVNFAKSL